MEPVFWNNGEPLGKVGKDKLISLILSHLHIATDIYPSNSLIWCSDKNINILLEKNKNIIKIL